MVDNFRSFKKSVDLFFHNQTVLQHITVIIFWMLRSVNTDISIRSFVFSTAPITRFFSYLILLKKSFGFRRMMASFKKTYPAFQGLPVTFRRTILNFFTIRLGFKYVLTYLTLVRKEFRYFIFTTFRSAHLRNISQHLVYGNIYFEVV